MAQKNRPQAETLSGSPQPNFTNFSSKAIIAKRDPTTGDTGYDLGQEWINKVNNTAWILTSVAGGLANWAVEAGGTTALSTLTGDSGGAISPTGGNINLLGTANQITTTGAGSTITWSLPSAIITPGSLTVTGAALFQGSFTVDNANNIITMNSGTGTISIGTDTTTTTMNIGTGGASGVKNLSLGSPNGASATTLQSGSGTLLIQSANGTMNIQNGTGTLSIANDDTAQTVRLGTGAGVKAVSVGSVNTTSSTTIQSGTGNLNITSTNGDIAISSGTGALTIAGDATANVIRLGTGAGQKDVNIGSTNSASSTVITAGTQGIAYTSGQSVSSVAVNNALSPYTVTAAHEFIYVDTAAAVTVNLPASPRPGHRVVVGDATGTASAFNITVQGNGHNISLPGGTSAASKVINTDFTFYDLYYNGTIWNGV